jgi:multidrug transporter EmrE-like cation transporter
MQLSDSFQTGLYLTGVELIGDVALRDYAKHNNTGSLAVGTASYLSLEAILIQKLKNNKLSIVNGYWDGLSNIATMMAGIALGEELTTLQITGLLVISAGMFMLEYERK